MNELLRGILAFEDIKNRNYWILIRNWTMGKFLAVFLTNAFSSRHAHNVVVVVKQNVNHALCIQYVTCYCVFKPHQFGTTRLFHTKNDIYRDAGRYKYAHF